MSCGRIKKIRPIDVAENIFSLTWSTEFFFIGVTWISVATKRELTQDRLDHFAKHVRETEIAAGMSIGETRVVKAEKV